MMSGMDMMLGALVLGWAVAGLFFLRFWRSTGDRFFLWFALSFFLEALNRLLMGLNEVLRDQAPLYYLVRLLAYSLILWAILEKNWPRRKD